MKKIAVRPRTAQSDAYLFDGTAEAADQIVAMAKADGTYVVRQLDRGGIARVSIDMKYADPGYEFASIKLGDYLVRTVDASLGRTDVYYTVLSEQAYKEEFVPVEG